MCLLEISITLQIDRLPQEVLAECGIHESVIEHMAVFLLYLTRRNRRITTIVQYHNVIKRLMLFLETLNIKRIEKISRDNLGAFIEYLQDSQLNVNGH